MMQTVPVVRFTIRGEDATEGLGRPYTCVYDGTCKVCTRLANVLRKWDARHEQLEIVPSQAPGVMARFPWIPAKAYAEALQLIVNALPEALLDRLRRAQVLAASERLADIARTHGFTDVVIAHSARPADLVAAAAGTPAE